MAVFLSKNPPILIENVCSDGQAEGKITIFLRKSMQINSLQISENSINESFETTNNLFDSFRIFSSEIFVQVSELIGEITQNFLK